MNINDLLLEITAQHNKTELSNESLASICLKSVFELPFFNNQYQSYFLKTDGKEFRLTIPNTDNNKNGHYSYPDNFFSHNDSLINTKTVFYSQDVLESKDKLYSYLKEANTFREFINLIKDEIKHNQEFLVNLKHFDNHQTVFELLSQFLDTSSLNRENLINNTGNIQIKLQKSSFYARDTLNDYFLNTHLKTINENREDFFYTLFSYSKNKLDNSTLLKFLLQTSLKNSDYLFLRSNDYTEQQFNDLIKKLKENDHYTKILLNSDDILLDLTELHWKGLQKKTSLHYNFNEKNIQSESKLFEKYEKNIQLVINELKERLPYIFKDSIDHSQLYFEVYGIKNKAKDPFSNKPAEHRVLSLTELKQLLEGLHNTSKLEYRLSETEQLDKNLTQQFLTSNLSISPNTLSAADGLKLFGNKSFSNCNETLDFFVKLKYYDTTLGMALFTNEGDTLKTEMVNILRPFQGNKLTTYFYKLMADLAIQQQLIITTSNYTDDGSKKLKNLKSKLFKQYPNLIHSSSDGSEPENSAEQRFSNIFSDHYLITKTSYDTKLKVYHQLLTEETELGVILKSCKSYQDFNNVRDKISDRNKDIIQDLLFDIGNQKKSIKPKFN